jgi:hypothetical protein
LFDEQRYPIHEYSLLQAMIFVCLLLPPVLRLAAPSQLYEILIPFAWISRGLLMRISPRRTAPPRRSTMLDIIYLATGIGFFLLMAGYLRLVARA